MQNQLEDKKEEQTSQPQEPKKVPHEDRIAVLAIAYHNMGVELEYLKRFDEAIQTYNKAVKFTTNNLGPQHQLTENLQNVLKAASAQIENHRVNEMKRKEKKYQGNKTKTTNQLAQTTNLYKDSKSQKRGQTAPYTKLSQPSGQAQYSTTQTAFNPGKKNSQGSIYPRSPQNYPSNQTKLRPLQQANLYQTQPKQYKARQVEPQQQTGPDDNQELNLDSQPNQEKNMNEGEGNPNNFNEDENNN